jgi:hypothetical protein
VGEIIMSCLDCHDYMDGFNRGKREGVIEELEKLKAEFEKDKYILLNQTVAIQIMDKHISELKGE